MKNFLFVFFLLLAVFSAVEAAVPVPTADVDGAAGASSLFESAQRAFQEKRFKDAKDSLLRLVAKFPLSEAIPKSRLLLANLEEDFNVSIQQFKMLSQEYNHKPEGETALKHLGSRYYLADRYEDAAKSYEDFLKAYPKSPDAPEARYWLGSCRMALGQNRKAIKEFDKAIKLAPEGPWAPKAYLGLGNAYLKEKKFGNAQKQYLKLLDKYPRFDEMNLVYFKLGKTFEAQGKYKEAYASYQTLTRTFPRALEVSDARDRMDYLAKQVPGVKPPPSEAYSEESPAIPTPVLEAEAPPTPAAMPTPIPELVKAVEHVVSFQVQAGVYSVKKNADAALSKLQKAGYKPLLVTAQRQDQAYPLYKVRVGGYPDRPAAQKAASDISHNHKLPAIVVED